MDIGVLQPHKWENAMTIDKVSWGFRRNINIEDILRKQFLNTLFAAVLYLSLKDYLAGSPSSRTHIKQVLTRYTRLYVQFASIYVIKCLNVHRS